MDKLGSIMRAKDHYGNDQISGQQIGACLRVAEITLDRGMMSRWMKAADIVGKGIYSIPVLLDIMEKAAQVGKSGEMASKRKDQPVKESKHEMVDYDASDSSWKNLLDLNSSLPKQKMKDAMVDSNMKQKHVMRMKGAMYQSYNQNQGYLPPKEVVQLALAYSTVFHLGLDQAGIKEAICGARGHKVDREMVNIETFIQTILEYIM